MTRACGLLSQKRRPPFFGSVIMLDATQGHKKSGVSFMSITRGVVLSLAFLAGPGVAMAAEEFKLPKEVTPKLRAACETDVRRLCIGANPTVDKVKSCVMSKYFQLGKRCQVELASAGFSP